MHLPKDFISGFASAVASLGAEGDQRGVDWSEPFEYLRGRLGSFEPNKPVEIAGIKIVMSATVAPGVIEIHHGDGRVEAFLVQDQEPRVMTPFDK